MKEIYEYLQNCEQFNIDGVCEYMYVCVVCVGFYVYIFLVEKGEGMVFE